MSERFAKTGLLTRFILKRDRFRLSLWVIGIWFFTIIVPVSFDSLYPSQSERDMMADTMNNPAMIAMVGPADLSNYTIGVMTSHQMLLITAVVVGLMSILLVTRYTRTDEEDGKLELIQSLPVGRLSTLNATIIVLVVTNVILAVITAIGLSVLGIESVDVSGSILYGATLGATGILFAMITAFFAQITESSRGTIGLSITVLLGAYLLRAIGDVSVEALSWISPLGWVPMTEIYANNDWWPIFLMLGLAIIFFIAAYYFNSIRDLGSGMLPARKGKIHASRSLQSPVGLAFRLQRTGTIAWAVGMIVLGATYGSVFGDLESFFEGNEIFIEMLSIDGGTTYTEQFIAILMVIVALFATIPPIMNVIKLYNEEKKGRIGHLLSRSVSRYQLLMSFLIISIINAFLMVSLTAIGLWAAGDAVVEGGLDFWNIYGAALAYYPAMLFFIGLAVLFVGFKPRFSSIVWIYLFFSFIVLYFGELFQFPEWIGKLSPFGHIPGMPIDEFELLPIIWLTVGAMLLMIIGALGYRRRDIQE